MNTLFRFRAGPNTPRGVFVNTAFEACSIHESGRMVYNCLKDGHGYSLDYCSLDMIDLGALKQKGEIRRQDGAEGVVKYDFWVFNWHFTTMESHLSLDKIARLPGLKFNILLELEPGNPLVYVPKDVFDGYLALDPLDQGGGKIFSFPRPLEGMGREQKPARAIPVISSFGFGTPGKGFEMVIEAANREFDEAIVRVNIPAGAYTAGSDGFHNENYPRYLARIGRSIAKKGIAVRFSFDFMSPEQLVDWCSESDLNCFLYTRRQPGLSATTDQAIMSGQPLITGTNDTFRHIHRYIPPYPVMSLKEAIEETGPMVRRLQEDWSKEAFARNFERMLRIYGLGSDRPWSVHPRRDQTADHLGTVLIATSKTESVRPLLDYEARMADALGRSGTRKTVVRTCRTEADFAGCLALDGVEAVICLDMPETSAWPQRFAREKECPVIFIADTVSSEVHEQGVARMERRPIVPYFTSTSRAPKERKKIWLVGFDVARDDLAELLLRIGQETDDAEVYVEVSDGEQEEATRRISSILTSPQCRDLTAEVRSLTELPAESVVSAFGESSAIIISAHQRRMAWIEALCSLALTTERAVAFTRAAPLPALKGMGTYVEDIGIPDLIRQGVIGQTALVSEIGEWNIVARFERTLAQLQPKSSRQQPNLSALSEQALKQNAIAARLGSNLGLAASLPAIRDLLSTTGETFVEEAHHLLLGREPSFSERDRLRERLALTGNPAAICGLLVFSEENMARLAGEDVPTDRLRALLEAVDASIAEMACAELLGRPATPLDHDIVRKLGSDGLERAEVLGTLLFSEEAIQLAESREVDARRRPLAVDGDPEAFVQAAFLRFLGRMAGADELTRYREDIDSGLSAEELAAGLFLSDGGRRRHEALGFDTPLWTCSEAADASTRATATYQTILGRPPTREEHEGLADRILALDGRTEAYVGELLLSPEGTSRFAERLRTAGESPSLAKVATDLPMSDRDPSVLSVHMDPGGGKAPSLWTRLCFHRSGKPRKFVRRALFHANGKPRGALRKAVLHRDGRPRRAFWPWMSSQAYLTLPGAIGVLNQNPVAGQSAPDWMREGHRPLWVKLLFHRSGKPRKMVRRALFHTDGRPRGTFRRWVLHKDGRPRRWFSLWMRTSHATTVSESHAETRRPPSAAAVVTSVPFRVTPSGGRRCLFLFCHAGGGEERTITPKAKSLAKALLEQGETLYFVHWRVDLRKLVLFDRRQLRQLGQDRAALRCVASHPASAQPVFHLEDVSHAPESWLLAPNAPRRSPDLDHLYEVDAINEGRRLGLRSAFLFEGADRLRLTGGAEAKAEELYMQALLMVDAIVPVSLMAENDLVGFFSQHMKATAVPALRRIEGARSLEPHDFARELVAFLADAPNPFRWLTSLYICGPVFTALGNALGDAFASAGVRVIPCVWDEAAREIRSPSDVPLPADGDDRASSIWSPWQSPFETETPRWILTLPGLDDEVLRDLADFGRRCGLKTAAILAETEVGKSGPLHAELAAFDRVFAASSQAYDGFEAFLLGWRGRLTLAEDRFKLLPLPQEERPAYRRSAFAGFARRMAGDLISDQPTLLQHRLKRKPVRDVYTSLPYLAPRPKLSICISTYHRADWVALNLKNLFEQIGPQRRDVEVLVVDNASTDHTGIVVEPYLARSDFSYYCNPRNVGILGNLAVTVQRARGEYVWITGDDDLTRPGAIRKILEVIDTHPGLPMIYLNYGYSSEKDPANVTDLASFLDHFNILEPAGPDALAPVREIAANCENFFTAIYAIVFRRDHAMRTYCQDTSGRTFSTLAACVPTAKHVLTQMMDETAYWIGEQTLVVNSNVSWAAYGAMFDLEHLPHCWDLAERGRGDAVTIDRRRAARLWLVELMWKDLFENDVAGNGAYLDPIRIINRLKHLPEFDERAGTFFDIYRRAWEAGHQAALLPAEDLFAAFRGTIPERFSSR